MSTRLFSRLAVLAVCLLAGLVVVSPASAGPFTAVTNLGEATDNSIGYDTTDFIFASSFTTGAQSYSLSSITALFDNSDAITHFFQARLYSDASGKPGTLLQTLSNTPSLSSGAGETSLTFNSPGYALGSNTKYWVAMKTLEDSHTTSPGVSLTASNSEISPVGWTIGDSSFTYSLDNGASWANYGSYVEKFSIDVTPEPATLSLLAIGGAAMLVRRRKTQS